MRVVFEKGEKFSMEAVAEKLGIDSDWNADCESWASDGEEIEPIEIEFEAQWELERPVRRYRFEASTSDSEDRGRQI